MITDKSEIDIKAENNISPAPYRSKYEYFDANIEGNIDDLEYIYSLPKSGFSSHDYLLRNGEKYSERIVSEYVEVLLKGNVRGIFHNVGSIPLRLDDLVIIECEQGIDIGRVCDFGPKQDMKSDYCHRNNLDICKLLSHWNKEFRLQTFFSQKWKKS
ncbi:MAG: hypothetical protein WCZ17_10145, partial [Candidatus Kapaibacterium sp.]